jgi:hypothetical protein
MRVRRRPRLRLSRGLVEHEYRAGGAPTGAHDTASAEDFVMLTLHEAVKSGRLQEFIHQEESRGIGPIALARMDAGIAALLRSRVSVQKPSAKGADEGPTPNDCGVRAGR